MTDANRFYDALETRDPQEREDALMAALPAQIATAKARAPYFADVLKHVDPGAVTSRAALAKLPVTRKSDLPFLQPKNLPFGGLNGTKPGDLARIFMSPGRSMTRKDAGRITGALPAPCSPAGSARARSCTTPSPIT